MWDLPVGEHDGHIDFALRTAACLGALGYTPHEVICIIAEQLEVDHGFVAEALSCRGSASQATAA